MDVFIKSILSELRKRRRRVGRKNVRAQGMEDTMKLRFSKSIGSMQNMNSQRQKQFPPDEVLELE